MQGPTIIMVLRKFRFSAVWSTHTVNWTLRTQKLTIFKLAIDSVLDRILWVVIDSPQVSQSHYRLGSWNFCIYIYIYIYMCVYVCVCVCVPLFFAKIQICKPGWNPNWNQLCMFYRWLMRDCSILSTCGANLLPYFRPRLKKHRTL